MASKKKGLLDTGKDLLKGKGRVQKLEEKLGRLKPTDAVFDMLNIRKERASKEFQNINSRH